MRAWPLRLVFVVILLGSLAVRERAGDALDEGGGLDPAIIRVARAHGLVFARYTTINDSDIGALAFEAPGCSRPVLVVPLLTTFDQEPVVRSAGAPGDVLRYVYIDRVWDKPDRMAVLVERIKYSALAIFGLTRYAPTWRLLLVVSPYQCRAADAIDWRSAWDRGDIESEASDAGPVVP